MSLIKSGTPNSQTSTQGQGKSTGSILNMNSLFSSRVQRSAAGESLSAYADSMKVIFAKDNIPDNLFSVIPVDSSMSSLVCGAIALVMRKGERAAIYTYIVESTIQGQLADKTYKQQGAPDLVIPSTAGDVYNYGPQVFDQVRKVCETQMTGVSYWEQAGADVIPSELKADDEIRIRNILHRGSNALETLIEEKPAFNLIDVAAGTNFSARIDFPKDQAETASGLPIRRTFRIELNASDKNASNQSMVQQNAINLSSVAGFVDILFTDSVMIPQPSGYGPAIASTQKFQPKLIITDSTPSCNLITPELQLLSLASVTQLVRGGASWLTALKTRYNEEGADIHSLNGLRAEIGDDLDVNDPTFDLYAFANTFFHPLAIELQIPECSDTTWILSMLRDSARGTPGATDAVIQAANNLTNGNFGKHYKGGAIAGYVEDRVVLGYYHDKAGNRRDIRDIDYLAVLNLLGDVDRDTAFKYADTYNPTKGTLEQRLALRIDILKTVLQGSYKIKGYATPILLSPDFLKALYDGIRDCGCDLNIEGYLEAYRTQSRGNLSAMDFAVRPDAFGNAYSGYGNHSSTFNPGYQGRHW